MKKLLHLTIILLLLHARNVIAKQIRGTPQEFGRLTQHLKEKVVDLGNMNFHFLLIGGETNRRQDLRMGNKNGR
jgi:hypothetical protein